MTRLKLALIAIICLAGFYTAYMLLTNDKHAPSIDEATIRKLGSAAIKYEEVTSHIAAMKNWWQISPHVHNAMFDMTAMVYGTDRSTVIAKRQSLFEGSLNLISSWIATDFKVKRRGKIPRETHRMWITSKENQAYEAPKASLEYYVKSIKALPNWKHHFWCVNPKNIPETVDFLRSAVPNIIIHSIEELKAIREPGEHREGVKKIIYAYIEHNLYCLAADILRLAIINELGGCYSDLGVEYLEPEMLELCVGACEAVLCCHTNGWLDTGELCCLPPHHPISEKYLTTLNDLVLRRLPSHFETLTLNAESKQHLGKQIIWTASEHWNAVFYSLDLKKDIVLIVPDSTFIKVHSNNSWFGKTKFGNVSKERSGLNIFKLY